MRRFPSGEHGRVGAVVPPLTGQVFDWLADRGIRPAGPPFWRYVVVDMDADRSWRQESRLPARSKVTSGSGLERLPGGRYATVVHKGHPDTLVSATRDLLDWAAQRGLEWDANGKAWGCRLEEYLSDPAEVPDMSQWETRLAFRLRD